MAQLSGYKLIGKIAEGGMATVFKAMQVSLDRPVAIKVLSKKLADHSELRSRFDRESRIIARLANPHIIHVIDRGITPKGMPYFVMEYVEGTDLSCAIKQGGIEFNRKLELAIQICKALSYAHKNGVIHRDIKPANVLIDQEGNARMLDFGIAQFYIDEDVDNPELTRPGVVMGTMPYMSPEQQMGAREVTLLSDIYSLGVLMYELFTGTKPVGRYKLPTELDPSLPEPLEALIMQCMEQSPEMRPGSTDDIASRLLKLLRGAHLHADQRERASLGITRAEDKFALLDVIRESRHGAVYLYEERLNNSLMVIKRRPTKSDGFTESKLLTSLKHRNAINIMGVSRNEQAFIIVMEYLSGGSLHERLINAYALDEFVRIAREIAGGISFAHKNRILHGNLRPSNILFSEDGTAKVTDFGLNEHYRDEPNQANWYNLYNEEKSIRTDIFAAGIIFYQMLTGELPEKSGVHIQENRQFQELPLELREMIHKMTARRPEDRYQSFDHVIAALDTLAAAYVPSPELDGLTELGPTVYLEEDQPVEIETRAAKKRSYTKVLMLLLVVYGVAVTYLSYTGELKTYINRFIQFAGQLPLYWQEIVQPWIEMLLARASELIERLKELKR